MIRALGLVVLATALVAPALPVRAVQIRVDASGGGDYLTIQAGLDAASTGDTVRVAPGTYSGAGNRALDFGGTRLTLWAPAGAESTIIDCGLAARAFNFHSGEDTTAVVRGFTVTRGTATQGGGLYCAGASPLVWDCWFVSNSATSGAGAFCASSSAKFRACVFRENSATYGSGITILSSTAALRNCTFCKNGGAAAQGTIYCVGSPAPSIYRCVIAFSATGPGLSCVGGSMPYTTHSIVFENAGGDDLCGTAYYNLFEDPLFCGIESDDLTVCANSPCIFSNNGWGEAVGALGEGCAECSSPVARTSWGRLKSLYR